MLDAVILFDAMPTRQDAYAMITLMPRYFQDDYFTMLMPCCLRHAAR